MNLALTASIADQLHHLIQNRIVTGEMRPGSRIDLTGIADEFEVSRTPVRDAIVRLEYEKLVKTSPRAGTYVTTPTKWDVREVCEVRKGLEWVATGLAAKDMPLELVRNLRTEAVEALEHAKQGNFEPFYQSDSRIHTEISKHTQNRRLIDARSTIEPFTHWLRVLGATGPHRIAGSTERHLLILDAIANRAIGSAQEHAALHLDEIEKWTIEDISANLTGL
jgi:DNA-binding GntR family transcriptional regulator